MNNKTVQIIDLRGELVATAQVTERGKTFAGAIDLTATPADVRRKFDEYEALVNGQVFSLLDEIEDQIRALRLKAVFEGGCELPLEDLQVFPRSRRVSFQVITEPMRDAAPACPQEGKGS
jgi:hypothetical protein